MNENDKLIKSIAFEHDSNTFKVPSDASQVSYDGRMLEYINNITNVEGAIDNLYDLMKTAPKIYTSYNNNVIYSSLGEDVKVFIKVISPFGTEVTIHNDNNPEPVFQKYVGATTSSISLENGALIEVTLEKNPTVAGRREFTVNATSMFGVTADPITIVVNVIDAKLYFLNSPEYVLFKEKADSADQSVKSLLDSTINEKYRLDFETNIKLGAEPILEYSFNGEDYYPVQITENGIIKQTNNHYIFQNYNIITKKALIEDGILYFRVKGEDADNGNAEFYAYKTIQYYWTDINGVRILIIPNNSALSEFTDAQNFVINYKVLHANNNNYNITIAPAITVDENTKVYRYKNISPISYETVQQWILEPQVASYNSIFQWRYIYTENPISDDTEFLYEEINNGRIIVYYLEAIPFTVYESKENYITEDLIACFLSSGYDPASNIWHAQKNNNSAAQESIIKILGDAEPISSLNTDSTEPNCLKFSPSTHGSLELSRPETNYKSFSLELYYKVENIGNNAAIVLSTSPYQRGTASNITLYPNECYFNDPNGAATLNSHLLPNKWNHLVFVYAKKDEIDKDEIKLENREYYNTLKIYLNGEVIKGQYVSEASDFSFSSMVLNGFLINPDNNPEELYKEFKANQTGSVYYSLIRLYSRGLTAEEVLNNYIDSLNYGYGLNGDEEYNEKAKIIKEKNENKNIRQIFFIKNPTKSDLGTDLKTNSEMQNSEKKIENVSFQELHKIKSKSPKDGDPAGTKYSKTSAVNCLTVAFYHDNNDTLQYQEFPMMDVFLQGTSSLLYDVKNYQIKNFTKKDNEVKKGKFAPNEVFGLDSKIKDSVYTLKCDYMDHSHRNNTPTAMYFDTVLRGVIDQEGPDKYKEFYSPPKIAGDYRDTIEGRPILVHYIDLSSKKEEDTNLFSTICEKINSKNSSDNNSNQTTPKELLEFLLEYSESVGSYMFNIDKEGAALGFEIDGIQINLAENINDKKEVTVSLEDYFIEFDQENSRYLLDIALPNETTQLYLYGYQIKDNKYIIEKIPNINISTDIEIDTDRKAFKFKDGTNIPSGVTPFYISKEETTSFADKVKDIKDMASQCVSLEGTSNSNIYSAATFYTINEANKQMIEGNYKPYKNKYDYYSTTLEPRYSYADECGIDNKTTLLGLEYYSLDKAIKFFKLIDILEKKGSVDSKVAKNTFKTIFSEKYCLTYYLQTLMFMQVDNLGKNAMFDVWGDSVIYPRPYDMDSQVGLDNTGHDRISTNLEVSSSEKIDGNITVKYYTDYTDKDNSEIKCSNCNKSFSECKCKNRDPFNRFNQFNTRNSKLWFFVNKYYSLELASIYRALRTPQTEGSDDAIYGVARICDYVDELTSKQISESQYNKDANLKYFRKPVYKINPDFETKTPIYTSSLDYLYVVAGSRRDRYREVLLNRVAFLDSIFGGDFNTDYTCRQQNFETKTKWTLKPYSPQYINLSIGNDSTAESATIYLQPDIYTTVEYQSNGPNKEILLKCAGLTMEQGLSNVLELGSADFESVNGLFGNTNHVSEISFERSKSYNAEGNEIVINNKYLNSFNLTNFKNSNKDKQLNTISLVGAPNVKYVNVSNNIHLTNLNLVDEEGLGANHITELNVADSALSDLTLRNMYSLTSDKLDYTRCKSLKNLVLDNCPRFVKLDLSLLDGIDTVTIKDCQNLETIICQRNSKGTLTTLKIENCPKLKLIDLQGENTKLQNLDLSRFINEEKGIENNFELNLTSCATLKQLILPKFKNSSNNDKTVSLLLSGCINLTEICHKDDPAPQPEDTESAVFNFTNIGEINKLTCRRTAVSSVEGLKFKGNSNVNSNYLNNKTGEYEPQIGNNYAYLGIFDDCQKLEKVNNCEFTFIQNMCGLFNNCQNLSTITNTQFNFDENYLTDVSMSFANTYKLTMDINDLLRSLAKTQVKAMNKMFLNAKSIGFRSGILTSEHIPAFLEKGARIFDNTYCLYKIGNGAFNDCTELKVINGMFANCTLRSVPYNLFCKSPKITTAESLFQNCENLTFVEEVKEENETLANLNEFFGKDNHSLTNINFAFEKTRLTEIGDEFFFNIPNVKTATFAFQGTDITTIPNGIFNNNISLEAAQGIFSNTRLGKDALKNICFTETGSSSNRALIDLSGLFFNCTELQGKVNANLFGDLRGKITSLGYSSISPKTEETSVYTRCVLGAFSNTGDLDFSCSEGKHALSDMLSLKNASYLFAIANVTTSGRTTSINDGAAGVVTIMPIGKDNRARKISCSNSELPILSVPQEQLTYIEGAFMGRTLLCLPLDPNLNENKNIININGLFANSTLSFYENSNDDYHKYLNNIIKKYGSYAINAAYLFSNTKYTQLDNILQLKKTYPLTISSKLLEDCDGFKQNVKNFCGGFLGGNIENGELDPAILHGFQNLERIDYCFAKTNFKKLKTALNDSGRPIHLFDSCYGKLESTEGLFCECVEITGLPGDLFKTPENGQIFNWLTNISFMFMPNSEALDYLDAPSTTLDSYSSDSLFSPTSSEETIKGYDKLKRLLPDDWLSACPQIKNINGLFCGFRIFNGIDVNATGNAGYEFVLGRAFDSLRLLTYANFTFAKTNLSNFITKNNQDINITMVSDSFLGGSINNVNMSLNGIFAKTELIPFDTSRYYPVNNTIEGIRFGFFNSLLDNTTGYSLTKKSNKTLQANYCWFNILLSTDNAAPDWISGVDIITKNEYNETTQQDIDQRVNKYYAEHFANQFNKSKLECYYQFDLRPFE